MTAAGLHPRTAPGWLIPAAVALGAVAAAAAAIDPIASLVVLIPTAAVLLLTNQRVAIPLLIVVSALNRFGVQSGDSHVRYEIGLVLLLTLVIADRVAVRTLTLRALRSPLWPWLAGYVGMNVIVSLLYSHELLRSLKLDAEIVAAVLTYVAVLAFVRDRSDLERALTTLWFVTVGEAALGLALMLAYVLHIGAYGVQFDAFGLPMVYGTQWEANIFGSFLLGNVFLLLGDYLGGHRSRARTVGLVIVVAGIAASMTRIVWLGFALCFLLLMLLVTRARVTGLRLLGVVAAVPVLVLGGLLLGPLTPFAGRLSDIVNLHSSSASGRLYSFSLAITEWHDHPIFGAGTGSFTQPTLPGQPHPWMGNLTLQTLQDIGLVGLGVLLMVIVTYVRALVPLLQKGGRDSALAAGACCSLAGLLIAFQTTTGFWFVYTWIVFGIGSALARIGQDT